MEIKYEDYDKLLCKLCWRWANASGVDFDELKSEANFAFVRCMNNYESDRGVKFVTYLYRSVNGILITKVKELAGKESNVLQANELYHADASLKFEDITQNPEKYAVLSNAISKLSAESKFIIKTIFDTPLEFMHIFKKKKSRTITKLKIQDYLVEYRGWSLYKVRTHFKEIMDMVNYVYGDKETFKPLANKEGHFVRMNISKKKFIRTKFHDDKSNQKVGYDEVKKFVRTKSKKSGGGFNAPHGGVIKFVRTR